MEVVIKVPFVTDRVSVFGAADRNIKMIREGLGVSISTREGSIQLEGNRQAVTAARFVLSRLIEVAQQGEAMDRTEVLRLIGQSAEEAGDREAAGEVFGDWVDPSARDGRWTEHLDVYVGGQNVRARTDNQKVYLDAIRDNDVVFGIGPAGTGKTYLAVAAAVHMLKQGQIQKLILARPAVEAGEKLGFLPGDLQAKVNPYLRPLFDALTDMMDVNTMKRFMISDIVEVVPLAYMRGRTLNRACIILDEAQNTTRGQMKMFLTRMGHGSKVIVTGDVTQIDLPNPSESGLIDAARILRRTRGVSFVSLTERDIVRHPMVAAIVEAYARYEPEAERFRRQQIAEQAERALSAELGPEFAPDLTRPMAESSAEPSTPGGGN